MLWALVDEINWQSLTVIVVAVGTAALSILKWRDNDVQKITTKLEQKFQKQLDLQDIRIKSLESKLDSMESNGSTAIMKAVEIKSTSTETRTIALAEDIILALTADRGVNKAL